jgi:hypothetical protein
MATAQQKAFWKQNYEQTLKVFQTTVVHRAIVGSLVTSFLSCESVNFFLNCPVHVVDNPTRLRGDSIK